MIYAGQCGHVTTSCIKHQYLKLMSGRKCVWSDMMNMTVTKNVGGFCYVHCMTDIIRTDRVMEIDRCLFTSAFQFAKNNFDSIRFTPKNPFKSIRIDSIRQVYTLLLSDEKWGRGEDKLMS